MLQLCWFFRERQSSISLLVSVILLFGCSIIEAKGQQTEFRAGAATTNISPWLGLSINGGMQDRKVQSIHDELHVRALVLDNGEKQLVLAVVDSCMVPREILDRAKQIVCRQTSLPVENMLISATHTHSAPAAAAVFQSDADRSYQRFLAIRIADALRLAVENLQPAEIGWGVGSVPGEVFNRRWRMKPGTIPANPFGEIEQVWMNPPAGSPDLIEPAGPVDPSLSVVSVRTREGEPLALLANYSLHYVGGTGPGHVSADYFGLFAQRVKELVCTEKCASSFVAIMSNGTSGNINNINFRKERKRRTPYAQMRHVANRVAAEAWNVVEEIEYRGWVSLDARQVELELGVRSPSPEELDRARQIIMQAKGPNMKTKEEIYARETLFLSEYPDTVSLIVQALRIDDLAIGAIPCEVFVETGLELKEKSPFPTTFTISLANGYNGYLPTPEHHKLGGYETWRARSSYLEVGAAHKITDALLGLLKEMGNRLKEYSPER